MGTNPYAPPKAGVSDRRRTAPSEVPQVALLYTVNQVAVATLLGAVLAGSWMMASNFRVMGQEDQARQAIGWSMAGFVVLVVVALVVPSPLVALGVTLAAGAVAAIGLRAWSEAQFGKVLEQHQTAGGTEYPWSRVLGMGLLFLAILFSVAFFVELLLSEFGIYLD